MEFLYELLVVLTFSVVTVWVFGGIITGMMTEGRYNTPLVNKLGILYPSVLVQSHFWLSYAEVL